MKSELPPLNSLVVFEAAARLRNFTHAADELCVTQGAVSRQIRILEEHLGVTLFQRGKPFNTLTEAGNAYYEAISLPLAHIAEATRRVSSTNDPDAMTLVTTNAMAAFWLLPRFARFQAEHSEINAHIIAIDSIAELPRIDFDLGLYYCRQPPANYNAIPLFEEKVFPVCSPGFLEQHPDIAEPANLAQTTLLTLDSPEDWIGWPDWFDAHGVSNFGQRRINLNSYPLVIQSALNGQGVALAWETLVDDYLESGLLVMPTDQSLATQSMFYLLEPRQTRGPLKDSVQQFSAWLQQEARHN